MIGSHCARHNHGDYVAWCLNCQAVVRYGQWTLKDKRRTRAWWQEARMRGGRYWLQALENHWRHYMLSRQNNY